jgi:hypothetical protein
VVTRLAGDVSGNHCNKGKYSKQTNNDNQGNLGIPLL